MRLAGLRRHKPSEETKEKMRLSALARAPRSEETLKKMAEKAKLRAATVAGTAQLIKASEKKSQAAAKRRLENEDVCPHCGHTTRLRRRRRGIDVPEWVPPGLVSTYVEKTKATCEEDAASYVRQLKHRAQMLVKGEL